MRATTGTGCPATCCLKAGGVGKENKKLKRGMSSMKRKDGNKENWPKHTFKGENEESLSKESACKTGRDLGCEPCRG